MSGKPGTPRGPCDVCGADSVGTWQQVCLCRACFASWRQSTLVDGAMKREMNDKGLVPVAGIWAKAFGEWLKVARRTQKRIELERSRRREWAR